MTEQELENEIFKSQQEANRLLLELEPDKSLAEDPRLHLTGVMNPKNIPYKLPKSNMDYSSIQKIIENKQYKAYYPQSAVAPPNYFLAGGIEPYFKIREVDDYAYGVLTIKSMLELYSANVRWRLIKTKDMYEIRSYLLEYRRMFDGRITGAILPQTVIRIIDEFVAELSTVIRRIEVDDYRKGITDTIPASMMFKMLSGQ